MHQLPVPDSQSQPLLSMPRLLPLPMQPPPLSQVLYQLSSRHIPTLQHVPKGVRDVWAEALHVCLSEVVRNPADLSLWTRLFMLAKCVLASAAAGHRIPWREILQRVKGRLQRWFAGDLGSLWLEACASGHSLSKRADSSASTSSQRSNNVRRAKLAVQDGQFTKALTSEGLAPPSPSVIQEMVDKHPQAPVPILPPDPVPPFSERVVHQGVKSFPKGFARAAFGRLWDAPPLIEQVKFSPR